MGVPLLVRAVVSSLVLLLLIVPAVQLGSPLPAEIAHDFSLKASAKTPGGVRAPGVKTDTFGVSPAAVATWGIASLQRPRAVSGFCAAPFVPPRA